MKLPFCTCSGKQINIVKYLPLKDVKSYWGLCLAKDNDCILLYYCIFLISRDDNNKENYPHRATELEENAASSRDLQHHMDKKMFDGSTRHGIGILQTKQPKSGLWTDNGKIHEGNQVKRYFRYL